MPIASVADLIAAIRQHRLLEPRQLDELGRLNFADPAALAQELTRRGWLTSFQAQQLLAGKGQELSLGSYVLLERVGEGGMGQVFKARHRGLGRISAVKIIRKEKLDSESAVKRFQREVRMAAQLNHPNVVVAYDADEVGGIHLLVMKYVEGGTDLSNLVKEKGRK